MEVDVSGTAHSTYGSELKRVLYSLRELAGDFEPDTKSPE